MTKKDFFEKYNGFYERNQKNGIGASILYTKGVYRIQSYKTLYRGTYYEGQYSVVSGFTYGMDGFKFAWKNFQKALKEARMA